MLFSLFTWRVNIIPFTGAGLKARRCTGALLSSGTLHFSPYMRDYLRCFPAVSAPLPASVKYFADDPLNQLPADLCDSRKNLQPGSSLKVRSSCGISFQNL